MRFLKFLQRLATSIKNFFTWNPKDKKKEDIPSPAMKASKPRLTFKTIRKIEEEEDTEAARRPVMRPKTLPEEPGIFNSPIHADFYRRTERAIWSDRKRWSDNSKYRLTI